MMINLSNYEEYFLLYIDNELSNEQREAVAQFALQYPHLGAELNMLQEAKLLPADAMVFDNKSSLYKPADRSININNYEEYFLLHTDKELSANQEEEVEQFVLQHPQLQEEFLLLQKAKLPSEAIECPDKNRLYKKPARRIIPLYVYAGRIAVAAVVAGLVLLIGGVFKNDDQPQVAVTISQKQPVENSTGAQKADTVIVLDEKKSSDIVVAKNEPKQPPQTQVKEVQLLGVKASTPSDSREKPDELEIAPIKITPEVVQQAVPAPEETVIAEVSTKPAHQQMAGLKPLEEVEESASESAVVYVSNPYTLAQPAVYKELNTDEEDQTLYVGSLQLNKAKVNGLFKKAAHLLGGKAKD